MRRIPLNKLSVPYRAYYQHGRWDMYARALQKDGILWFAQGRLSHAALHIQPLLVLPPLISRPTRLTFLRQVVEHGESVDRLEQAYQLFSREKDHAAMAAVASRAIIVIWRSGNKLRRMQVWDDRARLLSLESSLFPVYAAYLYTCRALTALLISADCDGALALTMDSDFALASSDVQQNTVVLQNSVVRGLVLYLRGRFQELDALLKQSKTINNDECDDTFLRGYLDLLRGLRGLTAKDTLSADELTRSPLAVTLRDCCRNMGFPSSWEEAQIKESSPGSDDPSQPTGGKGNPHACFFLHAFISAYCSRLGRSAKGLAHAEAALARGELCQTPLAEVVASLPKAQCLIDLGRAREAKRVLEAMVLVWKVSDLNYLAGCGALELAGLHFDDGRRDRALYYYDLGKELGANGNSFALAGRPAGFVADLRRRLFPSVQELDLWRNPASAPLRVVTLGDFALYVHGKRIYDRTWPHSKAKMMLKALIVHGGTRVSKEYLLDLLWPEAEGDQASSNLKMTTSRLRKIVDGISGERLQWLVVAEGHLSVVKALCFVDALRFSDALRSRLADQKDAPDDDLAKILEMYSGDFLPHKAGPPWIEGFRRRLRDEYLRGVVRLARQCLRRDRAETALEHLLRVEQVSSASEQIFALIMEAYLHLGYPADALRVFENARFHLEQDFGVQPGPALSSLARQAGGA
ncbi:DNA-binding transcriptional activator of the SARP family [Desulfonatronum zhilinae]|nr:DNA-binding transcriptional activator of the SARP family [Desulfonatronum zhilinae]